MLFCQIGPDNKGTYYRQLRDGFSTMRNRLKIIPSSNIIY